MTKTNNEIDAILDELSSLCCSAMRGENSLDHDRIESLVRSLSTNGWKRHSAGGPPLSAVLENRVRENCPEPAMHRGAEIKNLVEQIQQAYNNASRYDTAAPQEKDDHQTEASTQSHPAGGER